MNNSTYEEQLQQHGTLIYTNVGDSMMPLLRENRDLMVIERRPDGRCKKYDAVLYRRPDGKHVMHRILQVRKDDYVICGDNRWGREFGVPDEWIIGVLTAVIRDGKRIEVTDRKYQRYVHLWCDFFWIRASILWVRDLPGRISRKLRKYEAKKRR
jgi:hypothetical protein